MSWRDAILPGKPGKKLQEAWDAMSGDTRAAFLPHLLGDTSAEYLSDWLERSGTPVSASTIRTYRRSLPAEGSV
ncbi:hypothetical protein FHR83_007134 [Actinoplanes campanulatus]|uniref:Uncharacterized protein n=1 Tax=Actinoplanes campanulatus TaxID=113559 RepID=A0A7W5FI72_9ACTN|nr:hypothetical protein [Actinoplanes campanulatus]MBB3099428.1 hypothetical protein [Actinoplanes campanulatus]GGN40038.1 hypothetical protein GCM10010109_68570 [Actinoplanes campanulatus]GID42362.1 hypothetical protein Aca09nite_88680 [Actinoplanes campanulatus]